MATSAAAMLDRMAWHQAGVAAPSADDSRRSSVPVADEGRHISKSTGAVHWAVGGSKDLDKLLLLSAFISSRSAMVSGSCPRNATSRWRCQVPVLSPGRPGNHVIHSEGDRASYVLRAGRAPSA